MRVGAQWIHAPRVLVGITFSAAKGRTVVDGSAAFPGSFCAALLGLLRRWFEAGTSASVLIKVLVRVCCGCCWGRGRCRGAVSISLVGFRCPRVGRFRRGVTRSEGTPALAVWVRCRRLRARGHSSVLSRRRAVSSSSSSVSAVVALRSRGQLSGLVGLRPGQRPGIRGERRASLVLRRRWRRPVVLRERFRALVQGKRVCGLISRRLGLRVGRWRGRFGVLTSRRLWSALVLRAFLASLISRRLGLRVWCLQGRFRG